MLLLAMPPTHVPSPTLSSKPSTAGGKAGRIAASLVSGVKKSKKKGKGKGSKEEGGGKAGELFSGDGLPSKPGGAAKVYAGGARSGKVKPPKKAGGLSKSELNKVKRGGKGHHGFKSKARHRRR